MSDILLDTNVLSELVKPKPNPKVLAFLDSLSQPWICSITLHELVFGAERSPDPGRRAKQLAWIERIATEFSERTIVVDRVVAESSGRLRALAVSKGRPASLADALIAASAEMRGLTIATRNTKDFEAFAVPTLNPWDEAQDSGI